MHIFIDESGTFTISSRGHSVSLVGGLIIPDQQVAKIQRKYAELRRQLANPGEEVKGRLLSEQAVASIVAMLRRYNVLFEATAIDMGVHDAEGISKHKKAQEEEITRHLTEAHHPNMRAEVMQLRRRLEKMPLQLYVQSVATFNLIRRLIENGTLYYSQRHPQELGAFHWVADAKGRGQTTDWEEWWSLVVMPMLQSKSLEEPMAIFAEGDYSHFERLAAEIPAYLKPHIGDSNRGDQGTDIRKLMTESFRFSCEAEPGLELVDILANGTRRALIGNLGFDGWRGIPELMIHRKHQYIHFISLVSSIPKQENCPYIQVLEQFSHSGRSMLAPRFSRRGV